MSGQALLRPPAARTRRARGFTLIEVLAALAVLALTLGGMIGSAAFYGRNALYLQDKTMAGWVAHNEMVEVQLAREWPDTGRSDGRVEMAGRDWFWEREVEETPDDRLRRVTLRVRRDDAEDEESWLITLSGFFAPPRAAGAAPGTAGTGPGTGFGPGTGLGTGLGTGTETDTP